MTNLLKADFKRVFKDKLLLVVGILAVVFSVITPVLYALLFSGMDDSLVELGLLVNAKGMFFDSFVPGNNLGLIAPVLLAIVLWKDFGQGTVRNKLVSGYSRTAIVLSMYTVCLTVLFAVMLLHALLSLGIGRLFFPYQGYPFTWADFGYFMASLGLELLVYLFMAALVCWLCAVSKNVGLVIVGYVAILMGLTMVASILQICELALWDSSPGCAENAKITPIFKTINTPSKQRINMIFPFCFISIKSTCKRVTLGCFFACSFLACGFLYVLYGFFGSLYLGGFDGYVRRRAF